ncbi:hypothetical protein RhiirC2_716887 [Rhizophagus irregularis]|uniref:Protein kinase domain-containing protein n=1 Tax=Rhizophagus irregularis TaxID=588596 RepID=A0A2N1MPJ7_9GLOM|nr:hypothetical protein RhiirC2_716887 [Rhizophagus irregularis]
MGDHVKCTFPGKTRFNPLHTINLPKPYVRVLEASHNILQSKYVNAIVNCDFIKIHNPNFFGSNKIREPNSINVLLDDKIICYYDSQEFKNFAKIGSGGFSTVHVAYWKNTTKFAIKKFNENLNSMEEIINEINLMIIASHPNIIRFYGVTKLKECWRQEPDERPDVHKVNSELNKIIDSTDPKVNTSLANNFKNESETTVILRNDDSDLPNLPSCDDCDINSDKYQI